MKSRLPNGMGGGGSVNNMLKQAQKMQAQMSQIQEDLNNQEFVGSAGGGAVNITILGSKIVKSVKISPEIVEKDEIEMLEDLITAAFNQAVENAENESNKRLSSVTGNLSIPGLF
ncbi:MAG: YbaB/EbfC family nucleoid-associated protein [Oscillospiraceae bacterium]|nr:YbaB/EbfC family nucleoid-associated protein [Oscillospiraceae bacterium]